MNSNQKKIKVVFFTTTILEYYGGTEKYLLDTANELSARHRNLEIEIITMDNRFAELLNIILSLLSFKIFRKDTLYKVNIGDYVGNINYIKCKNFSELRHRLQTYDVVYSKNEILEAVILKFFVGYKNIKRLIFGCHTSIYYHGKRLHNLLYIGYIYCFLTSGVHKFHVLNSNDESILKNQNKKVIKISNPINISNFNMSLLKDIKRDFEIDSNYYNIVRIGRLSEDKGFSFLKKIIHHLSSKDYSKNVMIHIAGDGPLKKDAIELANIFDFVKYYGHINSDHIPNFLSKMQLLAHTSMGESFGLTLVESNMADVPVICFNIPGPSDIIDDGINGLLVSSESEYLTKIEGLINGKYLFFGCNNYIAEKFNDDIIYDKLHRLLISND